MQSYALEQSTKQIMNETEQLKKENARLSELDVSLPRFQGQLLRQSAAKSVVLLFSGQFDCYEAEESPVERAWFKLEKCSCSSA